MQKKRTSAVLTLILAIFMFTFVGLAHIVSSVYLVDGAPVGVMGLLGIFLEVLTNLFVPDFGVITQLIGFVAAVAVLVVALVLALIWAIKLLYYRRRGWNLLSPLLFLIAIFFGVLLVASHGMIDVAFRQPGAQIATVYFFAVGVLMVSLALHLVVVGLKTAGTKKVASLLEKDFDDEYEVIDETVEGVSIDEPVSSRSSLKFKKLGS